MKKSRIHDITLVFIVTFLSCWLFWAAIGKSQMEDYTERFIKENYGHAIIQQSEDLKIIKAFEIFNTNDSTANN